MANELGMNITQSGNNLINNVFKFLYNETIVLIHLKFNILANSDSLNITLPKYKFAFSYLSKALCI